jgi:D-amino-acid dehydrogenase
MSDGRRVVIVGGGVIGLCCAYALRASGCEVSVIERAKCGAAASLGNAGWITPALSAPLPSPGVVREAAKWMLKGDSPLLIRPRLDPDFWRWCWRFWRSSNKDTYRRGLHATLTLNRRTLALFDEMKEQGVEFEMHDQGLVFAALSEGVAQHQAEMFNEMRDLGYQGNVENLDGDALRALEPALSKAVTRGLFARQERYVRPETLSRGLVSHLRARDVNVLEGAEAKRLGRNTRQHAWQVTTNSSELIADKVVIAAGVWARKVLADLGLSLPLEAAKGYSLTAIGEGTRPKHALYLSEAKVGCSPYNDCVRLAGTLELAGLDSALNARRLAAVTRSASTYLHDWKPSQVTMEWAGLRPLTPDGLPVIGPVATMKGMFVATGHAMLGVTLAPATGAAISALIQGDSLPPELWPFRPERLLRVRASAGYTS